MRRSRVFRFVRKPYIYNIIYVFQLRASRDLRHTTSIKTKSDSICPLESNFVGTYGLYHRRSYLYFRFPRKVKQKINLYKSYNDYYYSSRKLVKKMVHNLYTHSEKIIHLLKRSTIVRVFRFFTHIVLRFTLRKDKIIECTRCETEIYVQKRK